MISLPVSLQQLVVTGKRIQKGKVTVGIKQSLIIVLTMDVN